MKMMRFTGFVVLLVHTIACGNNTLHDTTSGDTTRVKESTTINTSAKDTFEAGKLILRVVCKSDPAQSYALYIPAKHSHDTLPVIYFFDPHGDGSLPLTKYKSLADRYN